MIELSMQAAWNAIGIVFLKLLFSTVILMLIPIIIMFLGLYCIMKSSKHIGNVIKKSSQNQPLCWWEPARIKHVILSAIYILCPVCGVTVLIKFVEMILKMMWW